MKSKIVPIILLFLLLFLMAGTLVQGQEGAVIKVATDQKVYKVGEPVVITATNVGSESVIVPACADDWFSVNQTATGIEIRMKVPIICDGFFNLEPGESISTDWDQTHLLWDWNYKNVFPTGKQETTAPYTVSWIGDSADFCIAGHADDFIDIKTDKKTYSQGETIYIKATNMGEEDIWITCPYQDYTIYDTNGGKVYFHPINTCKAMTRPLRPGENLTVTWNQTYLVWERNDPYQPVMVKPSGEKVPGGVYRAFIYGGVITFRILKH